MTPQERAAEIECYVKALVATWPAPSPALAARLRALLNPIDLAERLARPRADVGEGS